MGIAEPRPSAGIPPAAVLLGGATALVFGAAAGYGSPVFLLPAGIIAGVAVLAAAFVFPFAAFLVLAGASFLLPIFVLFPGSKGTNPFDILMPPMLVATLLGTARAVAAAEARSATGQRADILSAARGLGRSTTLYYALAALSLVSMLIDGRIGTAGASVLGLVRTWQGLLLFPLGLWWLRDERRIRQAMGAVVAAGACFALVNTIAILVAHVKRAGLAWYLNQPEWPIDGANDGATGLLIIIAVLMVRQATRHRRINLLMLAVAVIMIVLTQSRSGLLALLTFTLLSLPRARWSWVIGGALAIAAALPLVPHLYWERLAKTVVLQRGSFEAYTSLIRVLHWEAAWSVFLAHPLLGVGFLGFGSVSSQYNSLRLIMGPAESYYLEIAAGMGLIGLAALAVVFVRLFRVGAVVARSTPQGTLGNTFARYHAPLITGLLVANITGENFLGMVTLAELSLWTALLIRAGSESASPVATAPAA